MQNKEISHPKKKMDIKVDYAQLQVVQLLDWIILDRILENSGSPEFLAPAV